MVLLESSPRFRQKVQILAIVSASVTCIGYGMHYAWTSPSIPKLLSDKSRNITIDDASYFIVFQALAMGISAPLFPIINDKIGRKLAVLLTAVPQIVAWIMIAYFENIWMLYLAKCIVGIGDSAIYATVFIYVCEISEPSVRHGWTNLTGIAMYLGIFLVNVVGAEMSVAATALICLAFSGLHLIVFYWVPESPYYLLIRDEPDKAKEVLKTLRMRNDVDEEFATINADVKRQLTESGSWKDLFCIESNRRALVIVVGLRMCQQFSGVTVFEVYAQYMFQEADVVISASVSAIVFTGISLISVGLCLYTVHKFGRRPLLIYSCLGCGVSLAAEAIYFIIKDFTSIDVSDLYWFPLSGMIVYIIFSALGLATLPTLVAGEVCSTTIKSKAMIINNVVFAISFLILPKIFQLLNQTCGIYSPFVMFAAFCFAGVGFTYVYVVETKGKTLEEIQHELMGRKSGEKQSLPTENYNRTLY